MNLSDAAHIHQVSKRTLRRWIADGKLRAVKVKGEVHVSPLQLERVAEKKGKTGARPPRLFAT